MKKFKYGVIFMLIAVFLAASCATKGHKGDDRPDIIRYARDKAPQDTLVGIGAAKLASMNQSKSVAETRARAEIARAMDSMVQDMIRDYQASSEVDPRAAVSFQEQITVALTRSRLQGAAIADDAWIDGTYYVVMYLDKANVVNEINQAQAAARLSVPAMQSFNAEARMNEAFDREMRRELQAYYGD